jgi:hypothetical protein
MPSRNPYDIIADLKEELAEKDKEIMKLRGIVDGIKELIQEYEVDEYA